MDLKLLTITAEKQDVRVMADIAVKASDKYTGMVQNQIEM